MKRNRPRGYSRRFLRSIKSETLHKLTVAEPAVQPGTENITPLITTFNHQSMQLNKTLKTIFKTTQRQHPLLQKYRIISAYRNNKNLKDLLVRSRFNSLPNGGSPEWTSHFQQHKYLQRKDQISPINQHFTLNSYNMVYAITCTHCNKKIHRGNQKPIIKKIKTTSV